MELNFNINLVVCPLHNPHPTIFANCSASILQAPVAYSYGRKEEYTTTICANNATNYTIKLNVAPRELETELGYQGQGQDKPNL